MTAAFHRPRLVLPSLESWVSRLTQDYPGFDEYDLAVVIEEKTGQPVLSDDFETVRALYLRSKLRAWSPVPEED
jgi:hypothetical protein